MRGVFYGALALRLFSAGAAFLLTMLLGRLLGPEGYGAYAFAQGWIALALLVLTLGFPHFLVRALPPALLRPESGEAQGLLRLSLALTAALSLAGAAALPAGARALGLSPDPLMLSTLAAAAILVPPMALNQLRAGAMRGLSRPIAGQVPDLGVQPLTTLALAAGAWALGAALTPGDAVLIAFAGACAALLAGLPGLRAALRALPPARPVFRPREWVKGAALSSFLYAAAGAMAATDVAMLGLLSTPEETGVYAVASRFFLLMALPALAASTALSHEAARLHAAGDRAALQALVSATARRTALMALGLGAAAALAGWRLDLLFGAGFAAGTVPVLILVAGRVAESVMGHPAAVLANAGGLGLSAALAASAALLNLGLNALLIPPFGATGAAMATAAGHLSLALCAAWAARARLGILCLPALPARRRADADS